MRWSAALLALSLTPGLGRGTALAEEPLEYAVKAVYLLKFGDYVEWTPGALPGPGMPFVIGVLGNDPFGAHLDLAVKGRTVQGRSIVIKRYQRVDQVENVQILYISPAETGRWEGRPASLRGMSVLTVSDGTPQQGAIINFVIQGNKVRFEIDADAAERADLRLSSKLLSLATAVRKTSPDG